MLLDAEFGYTPNNLRRLLKQSNLSQKDARAIIDKERNTFSRYLYDVDHPQHVTMSHENWLKILEYISSISDKKP